MNFGDSVTLGQSLYITIFSMLIVFATLLVISYILSGFKVLFYKDNKQKVKKDTVRTNTQQKATVENKVEQDNEQDEELVAVITAAIAASLSRPATDIRIRKIKRVQQQSTPWAVAGRNEQIR
ncbi:OadG family protein [Caldisalinibacter kiritimatiensis]|uniref:Sodium pump decarboxylase, gamma subunit n=1 Tax=Caldisalinibacter kiritimatiensis TaxID=1304284 RepID=R1AWV2_9FIRM|nr:OadG family protein [Caldisalinibacter kiritimatiensis]EOD01127.1 Sodium pump decarboxylase, gamma subunit [Caldisalinibacter kiritimatiensis]